MSSRSRSSDRAASSPRSSRAVDVDLGQLAGLRRRAHEVLEVVEVAERVEQPRHLAELQRVVAGEPLRPLPRQVRECLLQVARELVDLPPQVHVLEQRFGQRLQLRALLGRHRVEQLLHLRHRLRHLLEQLVERLRVAREEVAVALHEPFEVGLLAALALLEHLVELVEHVLHALHALGRHVLHALGQLVEVALHQLLAELVHELLEPLPRGVVHELVVLQRLHAAGEVGRELIELLAALVGDIFDELLAPLVAGSRGLVDATVDPFTLHVDDLVELLRDVVVDAAEVAVLELLPAPFAQFLQHLAQTHELLVVAIAEALLHEAAERRVEVTVVEQVVAHLVEQLLGVEIEARLTAIPPGVAEPIGPNTCEPPHALHASAGERWRA